MRIRDTMKPKSTRGRENDVELILRKQCVVTQVLCTSSTSITAKLRHVPLEEV